MKIPRLRPLPVVLAILIAVLFLGWGLKRGGAPASALKVTQEAFSVWTEYEGRLEAERTVLVMSHFQGNATIVELAAEGVGVKQGDVLARFDGSQLERELHKLESEEITARAALESLKNAAMPLEIRDLEMKIAEARAALEAEAEFLEASRPMVQEGLVSEPEMAKQKLKVDQARVQLESLEWKLKLTRSFIHPSALVQAQAKVTAAEQDLRFARSQIANSIVLAPGDGTPLYKPLYVGGEYRTVRIGDAVYPNQPFMAMPDMSELAVQIDVPEAELGRVLEGREATIRLVAFPDVRLEGFVGSVGSIAQAVPGQSAWQRYFHIVVRSQAPAGDLRIRPGMSATVRILSYVNPRATIIPRTAVRWDGERPWAFVRSGSVLERRELRLGQANDKFHEVLAGLEPGETVILP